MSPIDFLATRHSTPARHLGAPGPSPDQLQHLLEVATRVPDHGRLTPFRLLLIRDQARARMGEELVRIRRQREPGLADAALEKDLNRFSHAPLVIVVVARIDAEHPKIPAQEQLLSAGCVAYNLLLGAQALGFGAQWLTGWPAYDGEVASVLGLGRGERVAAFVHVGTPREAPPARPRPAWSGLVSEWRP